MNNRLTEKIQNYCDYVIAGKPTANLPIQSRYITEAKNLIHTGYNLKTYIEPLVENWSVLWIYRKDFMLEIIKALPDKPSSVLDHWVLGKAFGYTDEAIEEFLGNFSKLCITTFRARG
jgi:hypothetical protein